ncbi:MAG: O-antigen ligase family protein [Chloroflexi bacterium]|nr:O-antigen ligase family protein [Chloroflexota bacterium]
MQGITSGLGASRLLAAGIFVVLAYFIASAVSQLSSSFSLGMLARSAIPIGVIAFVLVLVLTSRETWFAAPSLSLGRMLVVASASLPAAAFVLAASMFDPTLFIIISGVFAALLVSLYFLLTSRGVSSVMVLCLAFPFLSYLEHLFPSFREFRIGPFAVTPSISFVVALGALIPLSLRREQRGGVGSTPILVAALAFVFSSLLASLISADISQSLGEFWLEVLAPFLIFPVILWFARDQRDLLTLVGSLFAMVTGITFISVYFVARYIGTRYTTIYDAYSMPLFANINSGSLALMILMGLPLGIALLCSTKKRAIAASISGGIIFLIAGLFLTFNRSAVGLMVIAQSLFLFKKRPRKILLAGAVASLLLSMLFLPLVQRVVFHRFQNIGNLASLLEDSSLTYRMNAWAGAIGIIRDYPVWGIGYGQWTRFVPQYGQYQLVRIGLTENREIGYAVDPHNYYLLVASSAGLVGLTAWLCLLALLVREALYVAKRSLSPALSNLALGALAGLLGMALLSFLGGGMHEGVFIGMGIIFWALVGIISVLGALTRRTAVDPVGAPRWGHLKEECQAS